MVQEPLQITASHDVLHSVMDSVLQSSHTLKFSTDSEHRSLWSVRFTVTGGARITSVTGHGVASWRSSPSEQSTLVEVFFKSSLISDTVLVLLNTELELVAETFSVPSVECEGSIRVLWCFFQAYIFGFFTHSATFVCIRIFSNTLLRLVVSLHFSLCVSSLLSVTFSSSTLPHCLNVSLSFHCSTLSLPLFLSRSPPSRLSSLFSFLILLFFICFCSRSGAVQEFCVKRGTSASSSWRTWKCILKIPKQWLQ